MSECRGIALFLALIYFGIGIASAGVIDDLISWARGRLDPSPAWGDPKQTWLLPILVFGPNNQIIGLKEGLVISRLLRRTAILPNVHEHWSTEPTSGFPRSYPFDDIFDVGRLHNYSREVVLERDLKADGWDGKLDALLYWDNAELSYLNRIAAVDGIRLRSGAPRMRWRRSDVCNTSFAEGIVKQHQRYRVVGVLVYNRIVHDAGHHALQVTTRLTDSTRYCYQHYRNVSQHLYKAQYVRDIADEFVREHLDARPFVAVQVRPYPDKCLEMWRHHNDSIESKCYDKHLHLEVGKQTRAALQRAGINNTAVFAVAHPDAHFIINQRFSEQGLTPVYLPMQYVRAALLRLGRANDTARITVTQSMFVEQEIAVRSALFIGTRESSITGMIRQERASRNVPPSHNLVFLRRKLPPAAKPRNMTSTTPAYAQPRPMPAP